MLDTAQKFEVFNYSYFPHRLDTQFCELHKEWFQLLDNQRIAIAAPRYHAKSTIWSVFYPIFRALMFPGSRIAIVSATESFAETEFMRKIKYEFESNVELLKDFGSQRSDKWTNTHLELKNGSMIRCFGVGSQIRGCRPNIVIMDDVETAEGTRSETTRENLEVFIKTDIIGTLGPYDQLIIIGTILHPLGLLNTILRDLKQGQFTRWEKKFYTCLKKGTSIDETDIEPWWSSKWSVENLKIRRDDQGAEAFEQEEFNNPIEDKYRTFKPEHIQYWQFLPTPLSVTTTLDPACALSGESDYTAIVTIGTDSMGQWFEIESTRRRMEPMEVIDELLRHYTTHKPHTIGFEEVNFQVVLRKFFDIECKKRGLYPHVMALKRPSQGIRKSYRIESLQPYFQRKQIFLDKKTHDMEAELLAYPYGRHDDLIDALASHVELIKKPSEKAYIQAAPAYSPAWFEHREHLTPKTPMDIMYKPRKIALRGKFEYK